MTAPIRPGLESRPVAPRLADKGRAPRAESNGAGTLTRAPQPGAPAGLQSTPLARALVAIELRVSQSVRTIGADGVMREETREAALSIKALADLFDVEAPPPPTLDAPPPETAGLGPTPEAVLEKLRAAFTPERTAGRIVDFALSGYASSETLAAYGDTEAGRQSYADLMQKAVDQGFSEARALFGELPEATQAELADTAQRVRDGLQRFVREGLDPAKSSPGGAYERARRAQFSTEVEAVAVESRRTAYNQKGGAVTQDPNAQARVIVSA